MIHQNPEHQNNVKRLLKEWEAMSQKGAVFFLEETVYLDMISFLESEGKWQRATRIVDSAIAQHPFSADLYLRKAELLLNCNMIEECIVTIDRAELFAPTNVMLRILKADLLATKNEVAEALDILNNAKSLASDEELAEIFFTEAGIYEDTRNYKSAFQSIRQCLLADASHTDGYEKVLFLTLRCGFFKEAIGLNNRLIDADAYNWLAWRNLGFALRGAGKDEEAIEAFEFAFGIEEKCKIAYMEAGDLLMETGCYQRAILLYENAIFNTHEDADVMLQLGKCYQATQEFKTAIAYFLRAIELERTLGDAYFLIGECATAQADWQKAIGAYKRAIELDNSREDFHGALANAYFQSDKLSEAYFSYRKATNIAPEDVAYWLQYVYFLINIGQEKMALKVLDKADMYCGAPEFEYCRVACLYQMGRKSEALYRLGEAPECEIEQFKHLFSWRHELAKDEKMHKKILTFLRYE